MTRRKRQVGSALAELALLAPVFGVLLVGISYFGFAFYSYNRLERAVHDAGRYACTRSLLLTATGVSEFKRQVRNVVVYGAPESGYALSSPLLSSPSDVTVEILNTNGASASPTLQVRPERIRITVNTWSIPGSFRTITITNKPTADFPFIGRFTPGA